MNKKQRNIHTNMGTNENPELLTTVDEQARNKEGQMFKGALGPLVNELKLLTESMDVKYAKLDEKYTKLVAAISLQKTDVTRNLETGTVDCSPESRNSKQNYK